MSYVKQTWVDRAVEFFRRFTYTDDGTYLTLTEAPGTITNAGTPLDSTRLNHMEEGIYDAHENVGDRQYTEENYVASGETITESINKLATNLNLVQSGINTLNSSAIKGAGQKILTGLQYLAANATVSVVFPTAFSVKPIVVFGVESPGEEPKTFIVYDSITNAGFQAKNLSTTNGRLLNWIAIGV